MENNNDIIPVELKPEFEEALERTAQDDDNGTLEYVSHDTLMAEMSQTFFSIEKSIEAFESENPDYAPENMPRLDKN